MSDSSGETWPAEYAAAALLLLKAREFAEASERSVWDFAVEMEELRAAGLTRVDLRLLICRGWLEQAAEEPTSETGERIFRRTGRLTLSKKACFVLTIAGRAAALHLTSTRVPGCVTNVPSVGAAEDQAIAHTQREGEYPQPAAAKANGEQSGSSSSGSANGHRKTLKPIWDPERNRLTLGDVIVKEYRTPAPNQQLILAAFQEEGWPVRIDDPLPPHPEQDPKRRLHETIISLNRNQRNFILRFGGDGSGAGIRWGIHERDA